MKTGRGSSDAESTVQMKRRSVARNHPPALTIKWAERLGLPECPYVTRWRIETRWGSLRVHHWTGPDDDRAYHDHPWWFTTFVIKGGYMDLSPRAADHVRAPAIRHRPALHRHIVFPDEGGAWTVLITGPRVRTWGFWKDGKFRKARRWFESQGHHPCS